MTFTDEDIRLLKAESGPRNHHDLMSREKFLALLSRLEAAENVIANFATEKASPELSDAYIVWREAAGK